MTAAEEALGKLAHLTANRLRTDGWQRTIHALRGISNVTSTVRGIPHKAARIAEYLRTKGAPVLMSTPPWTRAARDTAIDRGPHKSSHGERDFVANEMLDFCEQGYWLVAPYHSICDLPGLRISPLGVVPQRDRRPRLIVDYTFSQVNAETVPLAPREAMQFGRAFQRMLHSIVHSNPRYGPVYMSKIDIADGFYRVWVQTDDIPKLGVALPVPPGHPPLVAFPLALPMGWIDSPPFFTTLTETICDLANSKLANKEYVAPPHRLEATAATIPLEEHTHMPHHLVAHSADLHTKLQPTFGVDVYVDDFLLLAQLQHYRDRVLRATLHSIDEVFRPVERHDPAHRTEPASVKKMLKGDAAWSTQKRMLGWDVDTIAMTLTLPPHRLDRLREVLSWLAPPRKRLSLTKWHQLLGELRSMSPALPGTRGLFSTLQDALSKGDLRRVRINRHVRAAAADFLLLVDSLATRPTRLQELVPTHPLAVGACDACQHGMGGVWLFPDTTQHPVLWRSRFPTHVSASLVTAGNRQGLISISDLELAGIIGHKAVLSDHIDTRERTIWIASDNRAAVSWATKGSSTSVSARAYLLQYNALHQRHHRYVARHHYIPGPVNAMADDASRLWHLSDTDLLTHFARTYPQATSWRLLPLTSDTSSALIGALSRRRQHSGFPANATPTPVPRGSYGKHSAPPYSSDHTPWEPVTPSPSSSCLLNDIAPDRLLPAATLSALGQWRMPYERLVRRIPGWGPLILA